MTVYIYMHLSPLPHQCDDFMQHSPMNVHLCLHGVLQSHLLSVSDKLCRNYEMYATLRQYPEDTVNETFQELTRGGVICRNKVKVNLTVVFTQTWEDVSAKQYLCPQIQKNKNNNNKKHTHKKTTPQ